MRLDGPALPLEGWLIGIGGAFGCLIMCEVYKIFVKRQMDAYQERVLARQAKKREEWLREHQLDSKGTNVLQIGRAHV